MSATLIYLAVAAGLGYWLFFMGGKEQVMGMLDQVTGGLGLGGGSAASSGFDSGRTGSWTDENNNNFNVEKDSRSQSNVQGNASVAGIQSQVQGMLQKMGVNGSRQNISRTRQIDTTGKAKQTQTKSQRSNYAVRLSM